MSLTSEQLHSIQALKTIAYPTGLSEEADMVMKGGITSGVVYPLAVCKLAQTYRFRSLGGSSAGGIAAAFAAAAEANRAGGGFNVLASLPDVLGKDLAELFQPSQRTKPLFDVLLAAINRTRTGYRKKVALLWAVFWAAKRWFAGAFLAVILVGTWALLLASGAPHSLGDWADIARGLPILAVLGATIGLVASVMGVVMLARKELPANGHGLCRGSRGTDWPATAPANVVEPFTDWMHAHLNDAVGIGREQVLTMGRLWGPTAVAEYVNRVAGGARPGAAMRGIDPDVRLEMMTTNVTHCRPARLPFADRSYLFCPSELGEYVPTPVLSHLIDTAYPSNTVWTCPNHGVALLHLPDPPDFPVALAVRMTLSFPGLISAVPLYAVDFSAPAQQPIRCWFSDGGISSNFPIHFFDALWPRRPTFGISLGPYHPNYPDTDVYLPTGNQPRVPRVRPTETLTGFLGAIADTLQNWADEGQGTLPGFRDRIVDIHHGETEGGLNLTMDKETISCLAGRGYLAGEKFEEFQFPRHRWTRYLTSMTSLDQVVRGMELRYDGTLPNGAPGYRAFVTGLAPDLGYEQSAIWRGSAVDRTDSLLAFVGRAAGPPTNQPTVAPSPDFTAAPPRTLTDLRITPHF